LSTRVSNQVSHIVKLAQAKANLAAAQALLTARRTCETTSTVVLNCPIGRVKYLASQDNHEIDFDCDGAYDGQYGGRVTCNPLVSFGPNYLGYYEGYDNYYAYDRYCTGYYSYKKNLGCSLRLYGNWALNGRLTNSQVTFDSNCDGSLETTLNAIGCIGDAKDAVLSNSRYVSDIDIDCSGTVDSKAETDAAAFTDDAAVYPETTYRLLQTGNLPVFGKACPTPVKMSTAAIDGLIAPCLYIDLDCDGRLDWCIDASLVGTDAPVLVAAFDIGPVKLTDNRGERPVMCARLSMSDDGLVR
jgi:hypothetical protein